MATVLDRHIQTAIDAGTGVLASGLVAGSPVLTMGGVLPVEYLEPGDRIVTRGGARRLKSLAATRYTGPVYSVQGGSLGHMLPGEDAILTPRTRVLVRDWRAPAMFGRDIALVAVEALEDGEFVREIMVSDMPMFTLMFDDEQVIYAAGLEIAAAVDEDEEEIVMPELPAEAEAVLGAIRLARAA